MERILEELYAGDLQPAENRNWDNPEYEGRKVIYFEAFGRSGVTNIDLASSENSWYNKITILNSGGLAVCRI